MPIRVDMLDMQIRSSIMAVLLSLVGGALLHADPAHVSHVRLERHLKRWDAYVTVEHRDLNWQHFVDRLEFLDEEGRRIHLRRIEKPHGGRRFVVKVRDLDLPQGTRKLVVRAHDRVEGFDGGRTMTVDFTLPKGEGWEIVRIPWNDRYQYFLGEGRFMKTWRRVQAKPSVF